MPRKKRLIYEAVGSDLFSKPLQQAITDHLENNPPNFYSLVNLSPVQKMKLRSEKYFFRCVGAVMDAYFTGAAPPLFESMPNRQKEEIDLYVWRFLSFYGMIASNWQHVEAALKKTRRNEIILESDGSSLKIPNEAFNNITSPADALLSAIFYVSIGRLETCFTEAEKPTGYRITKTIKDDRKARRINSKPHQQSASIERIAALVDDHPSHALETICYIAAKRGKTPRQKDAVRGYRKSLEAREVFLLKAAHTR